MTRAEKKDDRRIQAYRQMREMMGLYYLRAKNARHNGEALAWITSGAPVEFLLAMDIIPIYPENHAAMCGIQKMSLTLLEDAEKRGYSRDLCSYARTDFGQMNTGVSPIAGLPEPDFLFAVNNICTTVIKWYEVVARHYDVPLFVLDMPYLARGEPDESILAYVRAQIREFVAFLEDHYKRKFDWDRLKETLIRSAHASRLWGQVLDTCTHSPSPMTCFDHFIHMAPVVTLRGAQEAIDYYKILLAEMTERIATGFGAVPDERFRLLWDNLPIWFAMKSLSTALSERRTCLVAATYTASWAAQTFDPEGATDWDAALDELGRAYLTPYINCSFDRRVEMFAEMLETYRADGFIMHSDRSCKPYSIGQYQIRDRVQRRTGIPGLIIEADMNDSRVWAEGPTMNRLDAYLESLEVRR